MNSNFPQKLVRFCDEDLFFILPSPIFGIQIRNFCRRQRQFAAKTFFWFSPECEEKFHLVVAAFRKRLVTAAKASPTPCNILQFK